MGRGWHARRAATDTSASTAIALASTSLDTVVSTSAATEVTLAWLTRGSAATTVTRLSPSQARPLT